MSAKPKKLAKGLWQWTERHPVVGHAHRSVSLVIEDPRSSTGIPPAASIGA
jgi:hypothetical protein